MPLFLSEREVLLSELVHIEMGGSHFLFFVFCIFGFFFCIFCIYFGFWPFCFGVLKDDGFCLLWERWWAVAFTSDDATPHRA